jgi:hypothetical protein
MTFFWRLDCISLRIKIFLNNGIEEEEGEQEKEEAALFISPLLFCHFFYFYFFFFFLNTQSHFFHFSQVTMGAQKSTLRKEDVEELVRKTHYSSRELKQLYKQFREEAPMGAIAKKDFINLTELMGITDMFMVDLVFNAFDLNKNGSIEFDEFVISMSTMTRGTPEEKLRLYEHSLSTITLHTT